MKKIIAFLLIIGLFTLTLAPSSAKASTVTSENVVQIGDYVFTVTDYKENQLGTLRYTTTHGTVVNITDTSGNYITTVTMKTSWDYQDGSYVRCTNCYAPTYYPGTYPMSYGNAEHYTGSPYYATVSRPLLFTISPTSMKFYINVTCDTYGQISSSVTSSRPF